MTKIKKILLSTIIALGMAIIAIFGLISTSNQSTPQNARGGVLPTQHKVL